MKLFKKIAAIMLSIMMVLGMASVVSAAETSEKGTITIDKATKDQKYTIYKLLDLESYDKDKKIYSYKPAAEWKTFFETAGQGKEYVDINENGYVTWKSGADAAKLAQKALAYAKVASNNINATAERTATGGTVTFDNLALGYYLVESSLGALCSLDTTNPNVIIQEKNGVPSVEKKVQEDSKIENTDEWGKNNTADIGQTVKFQTTITAQSGAQNYVLHDKMDTGLTFTDGSVAVKLKSGETEKTLIANTDYTLTTPGFIDGCTFEIEFAQKFCDTLVADDQIIVTYSATLNKNAVIA